MSSINLFDDEQIIYISKIHWFIFVRNLFLTFFGLNIFMIPIGLLLSMRMALSGQREVPSTIDFAVNFFIIALLGAGLIYTLIIFKTNKFIVTNKRIISIFGFLKRQETPLIKVTSTAIRESIIGRLLNYGTIIIKDSGGAIYKKYYIQSPSNFTNKLQEQLSLIP